MIISWWMVIWLPSKWSWKRGRGSSSRKMIENLVQWVESCVGGFDPWPYITFCLAQMMRLAFFQLLSYLLSLLLINYSHLPTCVSFYFLTKIVWMCLSPTLWFQSDIKAAGEEIFSKFISNLGMRSRWIEDLGCHKLNQW